MQIPRIYHADKLTMGETITLSPAASTHLLRVLRLTPGAPLILFNGKGGQYAAEITGQEKRLAIIKIGEFQNHEIESPLAIHLGQGISRGEKMDFTLQKAVELGVTQITPLLTKRCGVKLTPDRWQKRLTHWQQIIISACEQCGRNRLPILNAPLPLKEWLQQSHQGHCLALYEQATTKISYEELTEKAFTLLIGSEGGFEASEITLATQQHFQAIKLGPRILRTETAALATIAALQAHYGDF